MDDYIETTARWGKSFVEIIDPSQENQIFRAYFEQPKREWVGLTDDEVYKIAFALEGEHWKKIADAIEAKLKEKNT